jgi:hypothetical protein
MIEILYHVEPSVKNKFLTRWKLTTGTAGTILSGVTRRPSDTTVEEE